MDPALEIESRYLALQKPMNDVIDRGDSPVQLFYQDATVFLTGGSGFLGKQLIEKLFRSCEIKKVYLLLRSKRGKSIHERLQKILSDPVYDLVRKKKPQFEDRIILVEGDVADIRLGLNDQDWITLTQEVDTIFHLAATTQFDTPLRDAIISNLRGTREVISLAKECSNLKNIVYVSTAYSHATEDLVDKDVLEQFYPSPVLPDTLISLAEEVDKNRLNSITKNFIEGWANTYTFTKAVTEELLRTAAKDLPISIVRPPVVCCSHYEPAPGWTDISATISGSGGIILAIILGVMHTVYLKKYVNLALTPVDYVNNAIIGAGWDANERRKKGDTQIPIYAATDKNHFVNIKMFRTSMQGKRYLATDKAIYCCCGMDVDNRFLYWILAGLFHYLPAYVADMICNIIRKRPKQIKSFVGIYRKMDKMASVFEYFLSNEWQFCNDNLVAMRNRMNAADKAIYNCDMSTVDIENLVVIWGIGIRKYVIKDGLNNSKAGSKKQLILKFINVIVLSLYAYLLWNIMYFTFYIVKYLLNVMI